MAKTDWVDNPPGTDPPVPDSVIDAAAMNALGEEVNALVPHVAQVVKATGNPALVDTAGTWRTIEGDTAFGSTDAMPTDLVLPGVKAGDWVTLNPHMYLDAGTGIVNFTMYTIVAGLAVNDVSRTLGVGVAGVASWLAWGGYMQSVSASCKYQVKPEDIENDCVRFRMFYAKGVNARILFANKDYPIVLEAWA